MADYIKREDVYDQLDRWARDLNNPQVYQRDDARCIIDGIPSADVAPVRHGHWIDDAGALRCSFCGVSFPDLHPLYEKARYCPCCGSKMDEEVEE